MERPDWKLITQHSNSVHSFFAKHDYYLYSINETHQLPYSYAQFLCYNQENQMYREMQVKFIDFQVEGQLRTERLFNALKNIATGSSETEFFEYVLAMVIMSETTQVLNHQHKIASWMYIQETHLTGKVQMFQVNPYPVTLQTGQTVMGVSIEADEYATQKLWNDQQTHFLSHILRSHRQLS
jgi:hypothetical protein